MVTCPGGMNNLSVSIGNGGLAIVTKFLTNLKLVRTASPMTTCYRSLALIEMMRNACYL